MPAAGAWLVTNALAVATVAVGVGTAIDSRNRAKRQERRQEELGDLQQAQASERAARERRVQIRQARVQNAQIQNQAAVAGLSTSSAAIAGAAGVTQQAATGIGDINTATSYGNVESGMELDIFKAGQPSDFALAAGAINTGLNAFNTTKKR